MAKGRIKPGETRNPNGRPKGSKTIVRAALVQELLESLSRRGGGKWLDELDDRLFVGLVDKAIPREQHTTAEHVVDFGKMLESLGISKSPGE